MKNSLLTFDKQDARCLSVNPSYQYKMLPKTVQVVNDFLCAYVNRDDEVLLQRFQTFKSERTIYMHLLLAVRWMQV